MGIWLFHDSGPLPLSLLKIEICSASICFIYNPYIPGALICENVGLLRNQKVHLQIKNKKGSIEPGEIAFTGRDCIMYPQLRPVYCAVQLQISRRERRNDCRVWAAGHEGSPGQVGV